MPNLNSLEEVRDCLSRIGKTSADVARELGVPAHAVRAILSGKTKGTHGAAHKVAVALGLKDGQVVETGSITQVLRQAA